MIDVQKNIPLAPYTYFKIGGPAAFFTRVTNSEDLTEALGWAEDHAAHFFILGSGSNILVADKGFDGLVIKMDLGEISFSETQTKVDLPKSSSAKTLAAEETLVNVGAGVSMPRLAAEVIKHELAGFEWAVGVPGGVGGSVRGNAGCYGGEMKDVVVSVSGVDAHTASSPDTPLIMGKEVGIPTARRDFHLTNTECEFSYRHSVFKKHPKWVITDVVLRLHKGDSAKSQELVKEYSKKRAQTQDIGSQCAGCIFKNPSGYSAGRLVDELGLKRLRIGKAQVSEKHGNFIINLGGATAEEIIMLISIVKERVRQKRDIMLEEEIQYVGF